jgi:hypothetical protein
VGSLRSKRVGLGMLKRIRAMLALGLVPALLVLAGCASPGGLPPEQAQASDRGLAPVEDQNSPQAVKARLEASEKALSPAYLQRRRRVA